MSGWSGRPGPLFDMMIPSARGSSPVTAPLLASALQGLLFHTLTLLADSDPPRSQQVQTIAEHCAAGALRDPLG